MIVYMATSESFICIPIKTVKIRKNKKRKYAKSVELLGLAYQPYYMYSSSYVLRIILKFSILTHTADITVLNR